MKQNTKFLWMYIGILFSFALILIIFAGLSRNSDIEQNEGLRGHIAQLSEEKLDLTKKINTHLSKIQSLEQEISVLTTKNTNLEAEKALINANETALIQARDAANSGDYKTCTTILDSINKDSLTQSQLVMYESLR